MPKRLALAAVAPALTEAEQARAEANAREGRVFDDWREVVAWLDKNGWKVRFGGGYEKGNRVCSARYRGLNSNGDSTLHVDLDVLTPEEAKTTLPGVRPRAKLEPPPPVQPTRRRR